MLRSVLLGVGEFDKLVGGEGSCGEANGEVDALAKVDVLEDVDVVAGFVLIVLAHCEMVNCVCCLMFCWLMVVNLS